MTKSQEASVQLSPAIAALSGGGADAMIVYQGSTSASLRYTVRAGGSWSAPADLTGSPSTSLAPAVAALPGGGAVAVWQGAKGYPYPSVYDGATWSAPVVIAPAAVKSRPTVAAGVCGATAVAAPTSASGGPGALSMLTACGWSAPAPVAGTAGMPYAELASAP